MKAERTFMKPLLAVVALLSVLSAYSQIAPENQSIEARIPQKGAMQPIRNVLTARPVKPNEIKHGSVTYGGILVQLANTDNPLQLINPAAPPRYGSGWDNVVVNPSAAPENSSRQGLKLFSIGF